MSFAAVGGAIAGGVASAAVGSALGGGSSGASTAASAADPFASQRGQYQTMLSNLISKPSSITSTPGYQFQLSQGEAAVNGGEAASGYLNSGNRGVALEQFGQNFASNQLTNQELLLAQLSGANIGSPGTAGQILQNQNQTNQASAGAVGSTVGNAVSSGVSSYFGNGNSYIGVPSDSGSGFGVGSNTYGFNSGVSDPSYGVSYGFSA